jgi:hypothetical protein
MGLQPGARGYDGVGIRYFASQAADSAPSYSPHPIKTAP